MKNDIWFLMGKYDSKSCIQSFRKNIKNENITIYLGVDSKQVFYVTSYNDKKKFESSHIIVKSFKDRDWRNYNKLRESHKLVCLDYNKNKALDITTKRIKDGYFKSLTISLPNKNNIPDYIKYDISNKPETKRKQRVRRKNNYK